MPHTRKNIDCIKLKDLYLKRKLSLLKIGNILGYSSRTIEIKTKECKIPLRKPGIIPPNISDKTLKRLYVQKRMSSRKIARIYKCAYSYIDKRIKLLKIPRRNLASAHIISKRVNFSEDQNEKAYLIGFRIGDLRVRKMYKNSESILIDCGSTKSEQIKLIKRLFRRYGRVWVGKSKKSGKTQIEIGVNETFSFLLPKFLTFPSWTMNSWKAFLNILAGFIDAEGSFFLSRNRGFFSLGNYNKEILEQVNLKLHAHNFQTRLFMGAKKGYTGKDGYSHNQDYWILTISRKLDLSRFIKLIRPFLRHKDRINKMEIVFKNIEAETKNLASKANE